MTEQLVLGRRIALQADESTYLLSFKIIIVTIIDIIIIGSSDSDSSSNNSIVSISISTSSGNSIDRVILLNREIGSRMPRTI